MDGSNSDLDSLAYLIKPTVLQVYERERQSQACCESARHGTTCSRNKRLDGTYRTSLSVQCKGLCRSHRSGK
jgi:hypothetical protein